MSAKKLSKPLTALLKEYKKYLDGSFEVSWPFPLRRTIKQEREIMTKEMKEKFAGEIKLLLSQKVSKSFTFPDWYYVCSFFPRDVECCKRLSEAATSPHEKMFALLLKVTNGNPHFNNHYREFEIVFPGFREWYDPLTKVSREEFSLLWRLLTHFPLGKEIIGNSGEWIWDFYGKKCNAPSKLPYS